MSQYDTPTKNLSTPAVLKQKYTGAKAFTLISGWERDKNKTSNQTKCFNSVSIVRQHVFYVWNNVDRSDSNNTEREKKRGIDNDKYKTTGIMHEAVLYTNKRSRYEANKQQQPIHWRNEDRMRKWINSSNGTMPHTTYTQSESHRLSSNQMIICV